MAGQSSAFDKSLLTNLIALAITVASFFAPVYKDQLLSVGLFALSGAITNWLAIHMIFERVPFLYGSGVIPSRFKELKAAIKSLVMEQFFNERNVDRFIDSEERSVNDWLKPGRLIDAIDYDRLFEKLVDAIMDSSFGGMLGVIGGASALESLREPMIEKIKGSLKDLVESERFQKVLSDSIDAKRLGSDMQERIEAMVDQRLEELTPDMVKQIVQKLIKEHLGWLVVWGGVFGGLIGLGVSFIQ